MSDLRERSGGRRESGAFLLGRDHVRVSDYILFDALDPDCLRGDISMRGTSFGQLWDICRERGLRVAGDVHTHPGRRVSQSDVDRRNPMVARKGHVALIVPSFARAKVSPCDIGVHCYLGDHHWTSHFDGDAERLVRLRWW